ncbi:DUF2079 domain-containing protein [bacterium]|jgi:uncharacterized membrane protein|nr:DUF2079 domain-containing protein [bacterium]
MATIKDFYRNHKQIAWISIVTFCYCLVQKLVVHYGFNTHFYDLYFFDHALWNFAQGKGLYLDYHKMSFLGMHFYPVLFIVGLFYCIIATPFWLFFFQSILITLTLIPILLLSKQLFGSKKVYLATLLTCSYIPFRLLNLHDFHGELLIATCLAWLIYFLKQKKYNPVLGLILMLPFLKETAFLIAPFIGFILIFFHKKPRLGIFTIVYGLIIGVALVSWVIPALNPVFEGGDYAYLKYYAYLGEGLFGKLKTVLFNPLMVLSHVLVGYKIGYILLLGLPLGFLFVFSPYSLISLGMLAQNILSDNPNTCDIFSHYALTFSPILIMATFLGYHRIRQTPSSWAINYIKVAKGFILLFMVLSWLAFIILEARYFMIEKHDLVAHEVMKKIPRTASLSASSAFYVHLDYRESIWLFPENNGAEYVMVQAMDPFYGNDSNPEALINNEWKNGSKWTVIKVLLRGERGYSPVNRKKHHAALSQLSTNPLYQLIHSEKGVLLYKHR